jgi:hypothetical protein
MIEQARHPIAAWTKYRALFGNVQPYSTPTASAEDPVLAKVGDSTPRVRGRTDSPRMRRGSRRRKIRELAVKRSQVGDFSIRQLNLPLSGRQPTICFGRATHTTPPMLFASIYRDLTRCQSTVSAIAQSSAMLNRPHSLRSPIAGGLTVPLAQSFKRHSDPTAIELS